MSAACAAYAAQLAAQAQGFDSVWITGLWVGAPTMAEAFGCTGSEKIIGLVMIGTADTPVAAEPKNTDTSEFAEYW